MTSAPGRISSQSVVSEIRFAGIRVKGLLTDHCVNTSAEVEIFTAQIEKNLTNFETRSKPDRKILINILQIFFIENCVTSCIGMNQFKKITLRCYIKDCLLQQNRQPTLCCS